MTTIIFAKKLLELYQKDIDKVECIQILIDKLYDDQESIKGE